MIKKTALVLLVFIGIAAIFTSWFYFKTRSCSLNLKQLESKKNIIPLAIIGSGPAGLSAGLYGVRLGLHTVIFEGSCPGGQLTETGLVENWPAVGREKGPVIMNNMRTYVQSLGAYLLPDAIRSLATDCWPYKLVTDDNQVFYALSVIIATGSAPRALNIPGEREYWGKGVTTCALCDAPFYKNKDVVIVGAGDSACEQALQLAPYARTITLLVRSDRMRASAHMQQQVRSLAHARVLFGKEIKQIIGDNNHLTQVVIGDHASANTETIAVSGLFLAIGHEPRSALVKGKLALRADGSINVVGRTQRTSVPGIFAAGDVEDMLYRQAGVAAGSGIKAAIEAAKFLYELGWNTTSARRVDEQLFRPVAASLARKDLVKVIPSVAEFRHIIAHAKRPVLIDFYADHCISCTRMLPTYHALAQEFEGKVDFYQVDTMAVSDLEKLLKVESIPCFIVFDKGLQVARTHSFMSKQEMRDFVVQFIIK